MGAARIAVLKLGQEIGAIKKQGQPVTAQNLGLEKPEKKVATATMVEKQEAARRRARRVGSRSLLSGGRLGSAEDEGTQTTLGA
jgi:hypothetical protein